MRKALSLGLAFLMFLGFAMSGQKIRARADQDLRCVKLDTLYEIKDDPTALAQVLEVDLIPEEYNYEYTPEIDEKLKIIAKCPNISYLYICLPGLKLDKEFFNSISTTSPDLAISMPICDINLEGVKNRCVTKLYFMENVVEHFEDIVGFTNLQFLSIEAMTGFCQVDYSQMPNLEYLALDAMHIDDYKDFFSKVRNLTGLSLYGCNLQDKDTPYMVAYLQNLTELCLYGTLVDDISFVKDLKNLKILDLPLGVNDLSVLYEMPDIECVSFEGYTELFVDKQLTDYFDSHGISYTDYDREIRAKADAAVEEMGITDEDSDWDKIEKVTEYVQRHMTCRETDVSNFAGTTLDACFFFGTGVCHDYATIEYTLLKYVGIDAYLILGYAVDPYGSPPGAHAWNEVYVDGTWYGLEPMWSDIDDPDNPDAEVNKDFWRDWIMKPTKVDDWNWPENADFTGREDDMFALYHRTENDPMDTIPGGQNDDPALPKDEYEKILEEVRAKIEAENPPEVTDAPEAADEQGSVQELSNKTEASAVSDNTDSSSSGKSTVKAADRAESSSGIGSRTWIFIAGGAVALIAIVAATLAVASKKKNKNSSQN